MIDSQQCQTAMSMDCFDAIEMTRAVGADNDGDDDGDDVVVAVDLTSSSLHRL